MSDAEKTLELLDDGYALCDDPDIANRKRKKLLKHRGEIETYIYNNAHLIPNYGEKHHYS